MSSPLLQEAERVPMGERKPYRTKGMREEKPRPLKLRFPRDLDILEDVYRHKALTIRQIHLMHFGASRSPAQLRITKLFNHRFLHQIVIPVAYGQAGSNPIFNVLDSKGAELLREHRELEVKWHYSDRELSERFLNHAKLLNDFYVTIVRACRNTGYDYPVRAGEGGLTKRTEKELKADRERVSIRLANGKRQTISFIPDTYFQVRASGQTFSFFVEADNTTEKSSTIKEKFRAYKAYFETGVYQKKYNRKEPYRVLFVADGKTRLENLLRWANEDRAGENFWFGDKNRILPDTALNSPLWHVSSWRGTHPLFKAT